jgi:hypothetical protein
MWLEQKLLKQKPYPEIVIDLKPLLPHFFKTSARGGVGTNALLSCDADNVRGFGEFH